MPKAPTSANRHLPLPQRLARMYHDGKLGAILLFLPPALLLFTLFVVTPIFSAANLSLYRWSGFGEVTDFVGIKNYTNLLTHSIFHQSMWNSVKIILASILLQIPLALGLALLIYRKTPSNTLFRLVFLAPYILAEIASGLIWSFIFDGDYGVSAQIASTLSIQPFYILADKQFAFLAIITVIVWKYFGFHMMIFIAALQAVPAELIEAANMEESRDMALQMEKEGQGLVLNQFGNPDNVEAHYLTTGPEIWQQTDGKITHFVSSMGTTGTIMGISKYLKEQNPEIQIIGLQPSEGSNLAGIRRWPQEYLPTIFDAKRVDRIMDIPQIEAEKTTRRLARQEGISTGTSSGGAVWASIKIAEENPDAIIVCIVCDRGDRYLSTGLFSVIDDE